MDTKPQIYAGLLSGNSIEQVEFMLAEGSRIAISKALRKSAKDPALLSFLDSVETELGIYLVLERSRQQQASLRDRIKALKNLKSLVQNTLSNLQTLDDTTYRILEQSLNSIKGLGMEILPPVDETGLTNVRLPHPLHDLAVELDRLSLLADSLQSSIQKTVKRGAPPKKQRQALIDKIVRIYRDCFGKLPVSTEGSDFVSVLEICLESIHDNVDDIPSEIKASLKRIKGK